tara:strand:+ start:257 stop:439 length:183 start_codon:yes stop_codon:yes gene_type:complete
MSLLDWLNMNLFVDISLTIFAMAAVWKIRKQQSQIGHLRSDLELTIKNPAAAKRKLKQKQ